MSDQPTRNDKRDDRLGLNPGEQPPDYGREDFPYAKPSETDSERAYRLLAEDMKADGLISGYDMQPQPDYDYLDDDDDGYDYYNPSWESGYAAGFREGQARPDLRLFLARIIGDSRYRWQYWQYRLKKALNRRGGHVGQRHIPF